MSISSFKSLYSGLKQFEFCVIYKRIKFLSKNFIEIKIIMAKANAKMIGKYVLII